MGKIRHPGRAAVTAAILGFLGWVFVVAGVLVALAALIAGPRQGMVPAVGALVSGLLAGVPLIAISQVLRLLLDQHRLLRRVLRAQRRFARDVRLGGRPPGPGDDHEPEVGRRAEPAAPEAPEARRRRGHWLRRVRAKPGDDRSQRPGVQRAANASPTDL